MVPNGTEFAHTVDAEFDFVFFSIHRILSESFGILLYMYSKCLKNIQRDPIRHRIQLPDDSRGGDLVVPGIYADSRPQIGPEDAKTFMGHGIAPVYIDIHFFIFRKICKRVEGLGTSRVPVFVVFWSQ